MRKKMKILDDYFSLQEQIYDYFGYVEGWVVYPLDDARKFFWKLDWDNKEVHFADTEENLENRYDNCYSNEMYGKKSIYKGEEYTLILVDTHTGGNKFLQIFDNSKER